MPLPFIAFTAKQDHLIVAPQIVSKTESMSIWLITLQPDEAIICSKTQQLFLWLLSEDCDMEITTNSKENQKLKIAAGSYPAEPFEAKRPYATRLKNISSKPQKIITVQYNSP